MTGPASVTATRYRAPGPCLDECSGPALAGGLSRCGPSRCPGLRARGVGLRPPTAATSSPAMRVRAGPGGPGGPPRRRRRCGCPGRLCGGGSLAGGREVCWEVCFSCSWRVWTCSWQAWTMAARVSTHASHPRIEAWTSGGVWAQSSGGKTGCVSIARGYGRRAFDSKR